MRHRKAGYKLGRNPAHRRATLRNLVTNVILRERVKTTVARAKAARPLVERMITLGKRDTLHTRRKASAFLMTNEATRKLFGILAPRFSDRTGGYTRLVRAGWRISDGAELAILELVGSELQKKEKKDKKPRKAVEPEESKRESAEP